jgi:hypothetical protein
MAAFFVLLLWFLVVLLLDITEWITLVHVPAFAAGNRWLLFPGYAMLLLLGALGVLWLTLLGLALAGSKRQIVLLKRFARTPWIIRFSVVVNSFLLALIPLVAVLACHAASLTRTSRAGATVHFLYDEGIAVPRWSYALWMYRVSLQARHNWGEGSTVLDRLNKETLRTALARGKVVILATHGGDGYACTWYAPEKLGIFPPAPGATSNTRTSRFLRTSVFGADGQWGRIEKVDVTDELRLVYFFGCDVGKKASLWQEHLAPARVVTYNRWSTVFDHALWFAFTGPAELKRLQLKARPNE